MWARKALLSAAVSLGALGWSAAPARAELFGFTPITGNSNGEVAKQLSVDVSAGGGLASFTFYNDLAPGFVVSDPVTSSITLAYFDDRTSFPILTDLTGISASAGVSFAEVLSGTLPGGNSLLDDFDFIFGAEATSAGGVQNNGVHPGQYVTLTFSTPAAATLADVVAALNAGAGDVPDATGTLRIGIHVQGIDKTTASGGYSDAFVLAPVTTPLPVSLLLGMAGLGAAGLILRRFA
jgi:hypothetical protein